LAINNNHLLKNSSIYVEVKNGIVYDTKHQWYNVFSNRRSKNNQSLWQHVFASKQKKNR